MRNMTAVDIGWRTLVLSLLLFIMGFATHEVMHLLVLYAVGGTGALVVRPWHLGLFDATTYALHVQPDQPIGLVRQLIVNFLGPTLAAVPILVFYALIEAGDLWLESAVGVDAPILTAPEFNYGVPALIIVVGTLVALRQRTEVQVATG